MIYETDAVDVVCEHINERQLQEITASIKRRVNYVCESKVTLIQQKAEEMFMAFEKLQKQSESMFDNVSKEDIQKLLSAVANGGFDEEAVVKAYLAQTKSPDSQKDDETK